VVFIHSFSIPLFLWRGSRGQQPHDSKYITVNSNLQDFPWEWDSYGNPIGNVPWDGTGINCYEMGMGMGQINMSHGQP